MNPDPSTPEHENVLAELLGEDEDVVDYEPDEDTYPERLQEVSGQATSKVTAVPPSQVSTETPEGDRRRRRNESDDEADFERPRHKKLKKSFKHQEDGTKKREVQEQERESSNFRSGSNRKEYSDTGRFRESLPATNRLEATSSSRSKRTNPSSEYSRNREIASREVTASRTREVKDSSDSRAKEHFSEDFKKVRDRIPYTTNSIDKKQAHNEREFENGQRDRAQNKSRPNGADAFDVQQTSSKNRGETDSSNTAIKKNAKNSGAILQDMRQKSVKKTEIASNDKPRRANLHPDRVPNESKLESNNSHRGDGLKVEKSRGSRLGEPSDKDSAKSRSPNSCDRRGETLDAKDEKALKGGLRRIDQSRIKESEPTSTFNVGLQHNQKTENNPRDSREQRLTESSQVNTESRQSIGSSKAIVKAESRYFIMKSHNHQNVQKSQSDGVWATQPMNASILSEAFKTAERVILIFSVNESRHFQGYCEMTSDVGSVKHTSWTRVSESSLGGNFQVRWLKIGNLPFDKTVHIRNPWNENKPIKISRDGQELPAIIGDKLCELFESIPELSQTVPEVNVDVKTKFENRTKSRRSDPIALGIPDRYKPYEALNRTERSERLVRARGPNLPLELERSRLVRELHPRDYARMFPHTGGFGGPHGQYPTFPPFQGHLPIPPRTWQGPFESSLPSQLGHPFDRNSRR